MMTLIYGLLNARFYFDDYVFGEETEIYAECCHILDNMLRDVDRTTDVEYRLDAKEQHSFQLLLNEVLTRNKQRFLKNYLTGRWSWGHFCKISGIQSCNFKFYVYQYDDKNDEGYITIYSINSNKDRLSGYRMHENYLEDNSSYQFFLSYIMETMLRMDFRGTGKAETVYFPTTRTGFLLTYKTLVGSAMTDKFNYQETDKNLLTRPNSDFLTNLSSMNTQKLRERFLDIVEFIEKNIICGHISVSDLPAHDIMYTPEGEDHALPMFVTSGVVTEITPLLLFLQYVNMGTLLMEEPEISLHLELQWEMARVLIRLKNMGIPVFVTTHSDIILQHVNNMIKLADLQEVEKFLETSEYGEADLLARQDVAVYQFDIQENQKTRVTKLACGDYGFEAMTFYKTLEKLSDQIKEIEGMEE